MRSLFHRLQAGNKALMDTCSAALKRAFADIQQQLAPQVSLPKIIGIQRVGHAIDLLELVADFSPVFQPVRTVHLVLIEQIGQTLG
ncbi:hypothetical protein D3C84_765410 [compost metagenome]